MIFNNPVGKSTNKWLLNDKLLLLLMLPKPNPTPKDKTLRTLVKKTHDQNTSNYRTRNQKYHAFFALETHLLTATKPTCAIIKLLNMKGYRRTQKITILF
ncbi:hypothetical protein [Spiroplasma poulsonii]|uniref:hypothetical protein n=1 Tax=Spiroplasma poulsonii TaxID=2138 RepID=UPI001F4D0E7F|nr:hypothetical protein [Spiroplasma poulsonii]UNF62581.1 hypothetical protein MNU24_03755 [Spiroplasma poulsonii]